MPSLILSGCNGRMGRTLEAMCADRPELEIAAGFDVLGPTDRPFPVYADPNGYAGPADVAVDFSHPAALTPLLDYCVRRELPVVLATTGYSDAQLLEIQRAAGRIPVFRSANFSLGVNLLLDLVKRAAAVLGSDFDVEIVERHHSKKVDAPSGTALLLAQAATEALPYQPEFVYDRHDVRKIRDRQEIGISSVRGGTIAGDHEVLFAGREEVIELRHSAQSREVFAAGALRAAQFLAGKSGPGMWSMSDLVAEAGL